MIELSDWCILRTGGSRTLPLTRSLVAVGLDAWTPIQRITRRVPRSKAKQAIEVAFTPTYVFVRASHLADVRRLEGQLASGHPRFSIFRHNGATVYISDRSIAGLQKAEADSQRKADAAASKGMRKREGEPYTRGETIIPSQGPFAGLSGTISESNGRHTLVLFGTCFEVKIDTSALRQNPVAVVPVAA